MQGCNQPNFDHWGRGGGILLILVSSLGLALRADGLPVPPGSAVPLSQHVQQVADYLTGVLETTVPSASKPGSRRTIRMTTCAIQRVDQPTAVLLYQEQAFDDDLTQPYRQRFLQITASPYSQTVRSLAFKPTHPPQWVNFCNLSAGDRHIQPHDVGTPVCSVFLKPWSDRSGELIYLGNTPVDGCPARVRGAVRITNHIALSKTGMETWDRGFDAHGQQVWGAQAEAYRYRKIKN